jgi:hypothetical protein
LEQKFSSVDLTRTPTCPMCGASLPPLIIIPHLTRCLEDYKSFLEMSAMKFSGFAAAVKEETKRKVEPIEFGVAFGSKKLTATRCDIAKHNESWCSTKSGGSNKPMVLLNGSREIKLCKVHHARDSPTKEFLLKVTERDDYLAFDSPVKCCHCQKEITEGMKACDLTKTIIFWFCSMEQCIDWATKSTIGSWNGQAKPLTTTVATTTATTTTVSTQSNN